MSVPPSLLVEDSHTQARITGRGVRLVARRVEGSPYFFTRARVLGAGSLADVFPGTAHLVEHARMKGTSHFRHASITPHMKRLGGDVNGLTTFNHTDFFAHAINENAGQVILATSDLVCLPNYTEKEFEYEKGSLLAENGKREYKGENEAQRMLEVTLGRQVPPPIDGRPEAISMLSFGDAEAFQRSNYFGNRLVVFAQGDQDPKTMLDLLENCFVLPKGAPASIPEYKFQPATKHYPADKNQTQGTLVFQSSPGDASMQDVLAEFVMTRMILDFVGPIMQRLRHNQPLAHDVEVRSPGCPGNIRMGGLSFIVAPENVRAAVDGIIDGIHDFIANPEEKAFKNKKLSIFLQTKEEYGTNPYYDSQEAIGAVVNWGRIPAREESLDILSGITLSAVVAMAQRNLFQAGVMYEGKIQGGFPDHAYVNGALGDIAPARTAETSTRIGRHGAAAALRAPR